MAKLLEATIRAKVLLISWHDTMIVIIKSTFYHVFLEVVLKKKKNLFFWHLDITKRVLLYLLSTIDYYNIVTYQSYNMSLE